MQQTCLFRERLHNCETHSLRLRSALVTHSKTTFSTTEPVRLLASPMQRKWVNMAIRNWNCFDENVQHMISHSSFFPWDIRLLASNEKLLKVFSVSVTVRYICFIRYVYLLRLVYAEDKERSMLGFLNLELKVHLNPKMFFFFTK